MLPLLLLWVIGLFLMTGPIQSDLTSKARDRLTAEFPWAKAEFSGRDATLTGVSPTAEAQAAASDRADNTFGVRLVNNSTSLLAEAKPWIWSAERAGQKVTLGGFVANEAARAAILDQAKQAVPGAEIVDQMKLARGASALAGPAATYGLAQIGRLPDGKANLSDSILTVTGTAPSADIYAAATGAMRPAGLGGTDTIGLPTVQPYQWQAQKAGANITLTGFAPSQAVKDKLGEAAKAAAPNAAISNQLRLAAGAPAVLEPMATAAFAQLGRLNSGIASLVDGTYSITGVAPSLEVANAVAAAARTLPQGATFARADISSPAINPYTWSANRAGNAVTLSGFVPSAEVKAANVAAATAAIPGVTVTDQQQLGAGAPNGFAAMSAYGIRQLAGLTNGVASIAGAAYTLTGEAPSEAARLAVAAGASTPPAGFSLASASLTSPRANPYTWSATRNAGAVTLSGFVPDQATRDANVAAVRAAVPNVLLTDQQTLSAGAPNGFGAMARYGIEQLSRLNQGVASLANTAFSLTGVAPSAQVRDGAVAATRSLPAGFTLDKVDVTAPPPAPAAAPVVAAPPAPPAPPPAPAPAPVVAAPPAPPAPPSARAPVIAEVPAAVLPPPPPPMPVLVAPPVAVPPPPPVAAPVVASTQAVASCQKQFDDLLVEPVLFDTNSDVIRSVSYVLLGKLAGVAKTCPSQDIEIAAHTDSDGSDVYNQDLSERRAKSVVEYLVREGVAGTILKAVGYGESRPIAPNDTPENKQKNRRVVFTVK
jgi:outer membrane protein OmpA-like peptidoglycan-associated protein/osmotically-inducible protein OsmY